MAETHVFASGVPSRAGAAEVRGSLEGRGAHASIVSSRPAFVPVLGSAACGTLITPDEHLLRPTAKGGTPSSSGVWDWSLLPFTDQSAILAGPLRAALPLAEGATLKLLPPGLCLRCPA